VLRGLEGTEHTAALNGCPVAVLGYDQPARRYNVVVLGPSAPNDDEQPPRQPPPPPPPSQRPSRVLLRVVAGQLVLGVGSAVQLLWERCLVSSFDPLRACYIVVRAPAPPQQQQRHGADVAQPFLVGLDGTLLASSLLPNPEIEP
jgi:hypothetical protein